MNAAEIVIAVMDGPNEGFNDPGPADPASTAGGNPGTTLGEQRSLAMQEAAAIWAARLDSDVPIVVEAEMDVLECSATGAVLGSAAPLYFIHDDEAQRWYPSALANARVGYDLSPISGDIYSVFSSNVDTNNCLGSSRWYYGFDGNPPDRDMDFLSVVLHELAHGLGVASVMDPDTGAFLGNNGNPDGYSALVYDLQHGARWPDMSPAQRADSVRRVRTLAWDGPAVTAAAPGQLAQGAPLVVVTPSVADFSGAISETNFGPTVLQRSAEGELVEVDNSCNVPNDLDGKVVLIRFTGCLGLDAAAAAGAVGALFDVNVDTTPPGDLDMDLGTAIEIPTLHVSTSDAAALSQALSGQSISVALSASAARVGTESGGRVYVNATDPLSEGSSISHFDSLTRRTSSLNARNRDLLMEPAGDVAGPQVDLTEALLHDIGWAPVECGDGDVGGSEECDDGTANSNTTADACRSNCQNPSCGDGVVDDGEDCDDGARNGTPASACSATCEIPPCGNGMPDSGEACDAGGDNSDVEPDRCRTDCTLPRCGDGVTDTNEQCDEGSANGLPASDCLSDCTLSICGDGIVSTGEACDDGPQNSNDAANACRGDCTLPVCGDGVVDDGEECDDGTANDDTTPDACRSDCVRAHCGDAVLDTGERCDDGSLNANAPNACRTDCRLPSCGDGIVDDTEQCDDGNRASGDDCSSECTLSPSPPSAPGAAGGGGVDPEANSGSGGNGGVDDQPQATPSDVPSSNSDDPSLAGPSEADGGSVGGEPGSVGSEGCGCRSVGARTGSRPLSVAALLGLLALSSRRYRHARDRRART